MQMLEIEAGMTTKSKARYQVKRLDSGTILYFTDFESARIYSIQQMDDSGVCCSIRALFNGED